MSDGRAIILRPAAAADAEMVFHWRNDPFLIVRGSSRKAVTREEHLRWFRAALGEGKCKMFIVLVDGEPAGQVRFDRLNAETSVITAYLLQPFTGRGWGVKAIHQGCELLFQSDWPVSNIVACVREDNVAAFAGFRKAGFRENRTLSFCPAGHFTLVFHHQSNDAAENSRR